MKDIISNKKSKLLYQRGDREIKGIINLRGFVVEKKRKQAINYEKRSLAEIIKEIENKTRTQEIVFRKPIQKNKVTARKEEIVKNFINNEAETITQKEEVAKNYTKDKKTSSFLSRYEKDFIDRKKEEEKNLINQNHLPRDIKFRALENDLNPTNFFIEAKPLGRGLASIFSNFSKRLIPKKSFAVFVCFSFIISAVIFSMSLAQKEIEKTGKVLGVGTQAYENLKQAGQSVSDQDFQSSLNNFNSAKINFSNIKDLIDGFGMGISGTIGNLPINTPISTAKNLAEAGENISLTGENISVLFEKISKLSGEGFFAGFILNFQTDINNISLNLKNAKENLDKVDLNYIPEEFREKIKLAKESMPAIASNFENLSKDLPMIAEILGSNRPQKYLLVFQNNSEIRATGGFIGSYGILDVENGKIKNLFIDGIFNPDGQLKEKIVPPMPIQKINPNWSMRDANWFADWETSAKKIALFYEKTGGPTVDGVLSITPNVIEKLLAITGPIEMPEYGVVIDKDNFLAQTQLQVEELYDKQENKPKKILAELAPKIIENLSNTESLSSSEKIQKYLGFINAMEESLKEKQMIFYHRNSEIENMIIKRGWGGQILNSSGDYLSVVNSNLGGYKTDKVIDEQIALETEIFSDGSIINTVKITRKHTGGNESYDWYNRVNSDYMRVFVPLGSILLEASGHTLQEYEPPIDYSNFKTDSDVEKIEKTIKVDPDSGTYIFQESEKTVFGNWVYVSPGETVEVVYKYKLPYKINFDAFTKPAERYSMLIQKQSGSKGSDFTGTIKLPGEWEAIWKSQGLNIKNTSENIIKTNLKTDRIYGIVFGIRDVGN